MSNPIRKLVGQTAIYGLPSILGRLLNYLLVPLHTYYFAQTSDYGVISELYAWVAFLIVLLTFGMETAFFRFLQNEGDKDKAYGAAFWSVVGINAFFYLILLYFNNDIASALLFEGHNEYVVLLGTIVMIDAITALPLARLRAEEKALRFAAIQMTSIGLNIALNVIAMVFFFSAERPEEGVLFILLANLISSLAKPLLLYDSIFKVLFVRDWGLYKRMWRYAIPLFKQMQNQDRNTVYVRVMNVFVAMVCAVFLLVSLNIDIFKHFIQKEAYWEGLKVVPILLMANVFLGIYFNQSIWYKLSGKTQYGAYITIVGALLTIAINVYYIPQYQYMASAWATLIVYATQMLLSYWLGQRHYPIPYNVKKFLLYLGLSLLLFFIGSAIDFSKPILNHFLHNLLVLVFIGFAFTMEKSSLKASTTH